MVPALMCYAAHVTRQLLCCGGRPRLGGTGAGEPSRPRTAPCEPLLPRCAGLYPRSVRPRRRFGSPLGSAVGHPKSPIASYGTSLAGCGWFSAPVLTERAGVAAPPMPQFLLTGGAVLGWIFYSRPWMRLGPSSVATVDYLVNLRNSVALWCASNQLNVDVDNKGRVFQRVWMALDHLFFELCILEEIDWQRLIRDG